MYISSIQIDNFRQLKHINLLLEKDMTVLAGPNNSGKTTLIDLLIKILKPDVSKFDETDFPVVEVDRWYNMVFDIFKRHITSTNELKVKVDNIIKDLFEEENKIIIPECNVKFKIDYSEEDNLRNFMDYIMDLDENKNSFYFVYSFEINIHCFGRFILDNYNKLYSRFINEKDGKYRSTIKNILIKLYAKSIEEKCYFTDEKYENATLMDCDKFRKLFNLKIINAERPLDDHANERGHNLSKKLISLASKDDNWNNLIKKLPDEVLKPIEQSPVGNEVKITSAKALNEAIKAISHTNGNYAGTVELNMDIEEDDINSLLNRITCAKYNINEHFLSESSQGLGYSNLISMHIDIQNFVITIKKDSPSVVNLIFIEEPEAHMHPQMQRVFIRYLLSYYNNSKIQGLITTHSNEIVRCSSIEKLRVIRMVSEFNSKIFDLRDFVYNLVNNKPLNPKRKEALSEEEALAEEQVAVGEDDSRKEVLKNFYDYFFEIGYSEIIFADLVIMYEGDTERLYIQRLISRDEYSILNEKYIAFVQVGGAYAYNYKNIIEYLRIKTLIITDIDYNVEPEKEKDILESSSSNSTIKKFYCKDKYGQDKKHEDNELKIGNLYKWIEDKHNIVSSYKEGKDEKELIYLAFQTEKDGYSRTLEAAMLCKKFNIKAYEKKKRSEWIEMQNNTNLKFSIPYNKTIGEKTNIKETDSEFTLRDILKSTSNGKSDFMYSVIMNGLDYEMLPDYIKEGLEWLMK